MKILVSLLIVGFLALWALTIPQATNHEWYDWLRRFVGFALLGALLIKVWKSD